MGLFDKFKKGTKNSVDFAEIDSNEKVMELAEKGDVVPLYLMPLRFGGEDSPRNRVFVPAFVVELKDRHDGMVANLIAQGKVNGYSCAPEYKGASFIPSKIQIVAKKDGAPVFTETIDIW